MIEQTSGNLFENETECFFCYAGRQTGTRGGGDNGTTGRTQLVVQPTRYSGSDSLGDALPDSEGSEVWEWNRRRTNVTVPTGWRMMARRREIVRAEFEAP